jgi:hypothetical protein
MNSEPQDQMKVSVLTPDAVLTRKILRHLDGGCVNSRVGLGAAENRELLPPSWNANSVRWSSTLKPSGYSD